MLRGGESVRMELKEWETDQFYQENDTEEISICGRDYFEWSRVERVLLETKLRHRH